MSTTFRQRLTQDLQLAALCPRTQEAYLLADPWRGRLRRFPRGSTVDRPGFLNPSVEVVSVGSASSLSIPHGDAGRRVVRSQVSSRAPPERGLSTFP